MSQWISVEERVPEEEQTVWCALSNGMCGLGQWGDESWWDRASPGRKFTDYLINVTHWTPLLAHPTKLSNAGVGVSK